MTVHIGRARTGAEFASCMALRMAVFVVEQGVPAALEADAYDAQAMHFLACQGGAAVGTARVVPQDRGRCAKIGRVAVLARMRGRGIGAALMRAIAAAPDLAATPRLVLEAQVHAIGFYERLGYAAFGPVYLDAGIPHRRMELSRPVLR